MKAALTFVLGLFLLWTLQSSTTSASSEAFGAKSAALTSSSVPCYGTVTVRTGKLLGIRTRASLAAPVVGGLENGETIIIQSRTTGTRINDNEIWYFIGIGYVPGAFIVLRTPGHPFWCLNYKW